MASSPYAPFARKPTILSVNIGMQKAYRKWRLRIPDLARWPSVKSNVSDLGHPYQPPFQRSYLMQEQELRYRHSGTDR